MNNDGAMWVITFIMLAEAGVFILPIRLMEMFYVWWRRRRRYR
jgi:hypothetical protein